MLFVCVLGQSFVPPVAAGSDATVLQAQLVPVAASSTASGAFTARAVVGRQAVLLHWQLSLTRLSGTAIRTTFRVGGNGVLEFPFCAPCGPSAHGELALTPSAWKAIVAKGAVIVVKTRARPGGELHGIVKVR